MIWNGVMPAVTTPFDENLKVDHTFLAQHLAWQLGNGCKGLVMLGSLGEGATLTHEEKIEVLKTSVRVAGKAPVVAAISSLSTDAAVKLAKDAEQAGCAGLMVLPPYVYSTDWREMKAHVATIIESTKLSCMLYNNPIAYKTDFQPSEIADLAASYSNLEAVKESSADVRRVTAIREVLGDRLRIFVGVDDVLVEGVAAGAVGWVAGLVNAYPAESVKLYDLAMAGKTQEAFELYRWFLPLLRMDTIVKFVQWIKWVQAQEGVGNTRVRGPRLELDTHEVAIAQEIYNKAVATAPVIDKKPISDFAGA